MKNNLFKIAGVIALVTVLSKIIGFLRDVVIAKYYGATLVSDAYFYAYQFPSLAIVLLGGIGGPFHTATISVFAKMIPDALGKPTKDVQSIFNSFVTWTGIVFAIIALMFFIFADPIINIIASGATLELKTLAANQLRIMSPILLIGGVIGIFYGISNVYREFFFTSLSPTVLSFIIIIVLWLTPYDKWGYTLAWATLLGAVGQLVLQLPVFVKSGFKYKPEFLLKNDSMKKIGEILFPAMLGTTIGQINIYVDMFFASTLEVGAWSAIGYANRVYQFPVGVLITAMLVPLFPMFSAFVGKQDFDAVRKYFHRGLNSLWFIAFPATAFFLLFSFDTTKLLFQRGAFDINGTLLVSEVLFFLSLSIVPYMARDTLTRVFYAFDDSKTPFLIAIFSIAVKCFMNSILVAPLGVGGIALSTTIVTIINACLLAFLIRKKIKLNYFKMGVPVLKMFIATTITFGLVYGLNIFLNSLHPELTPLFLLVKLSILGVVSIILYMIITLKLKLETADALMGKAISIVGKFIPHK